MPIFIDRHDMEGTSAADVAIAHARDLQIQDSYGVKFLTYWFDEGRGTAFCLVDAPNKEAAMKVHAEAHGHIAGQVIPVELAVVEGFLGRLGDPRFSAACDESAGSAHRAVMFTDIVGSTEMTARLGDRAITELVRTHDALVRRALSQWDGREVKHLGDGIMACFNRTESAVSCAKTIQEAFRTYNRSESTPLNVRIGIESGEPVEDSSDLFGSAVQMASRLCSAASPGQILVSEAVSKECASAHPFASAGQKLLKGFPEPVPAFACS